MGSAAAEYDVLVHLKVSRESQKAMGVAAGTFRATMRRAAADQKAMNRAEIARTKAAEREKAKAKPDPKKAAKPKPKKPKPAGCDAPDCSH